MYWQRILGVCLLSLSGYGQPERPQIRDTVLLIHPDYTAVRQIQRTLVRQGTHEMVLADFPETVDPSTILLRSREVQFDVQTWRKGGPDTSQWIPTITSGVRGLYPIQVFYVLQGLSWKADYHIRFRFKSEDQPRVSCSFFGGVDIHNTTRYRFDHAQIRLIQPDRLQMDVQSPPPRSGIFMMDPVSPLSDLWTRPEAPAATVERERLLSHRISLPPREHVTIPLVNSQRIKAKRLFRNNAQKQYLGEDPMHQIMVIENTRENGLGFTLPAGTLRIEGAKGQSGIVGESVWPHTEREETAEILIGSVESVTAKRLPERVIRHDPDGYEANFRIQIINRFDFPVDVEWVEEPESSYSWTVLSSDVPYLTEQRKLLFRPAIQANDELIIQYQLQYKRPSL